MITSSSNAQVKNIIALNKKDKRNAGSRTFRGGGLENVPGSAAGMAEKSNMCLRAAAKMHEMPSDGTEYEVVDDRVFQSMCDTKTPQGVFKCDPHAALHRRGGDGQRKDTASDGT